MRKLFLFIHFFLLLIAFSRAQIINRFAGNGSNGWGGDGGPAVSANVSGLGGCNTAIDNNGNVYIASSGDNVIRKVNPAGIITTIAGSADFFTGQGYSGDGGPAINAKLSNPTTIVTDNAGNIFFADQFRAVIRKIDLSGIITTVSGAAGSGVCAGDGGPFLNATYTGITGMAFDNAGNLYISDGTCHTVRKVNTAGIINRVAGSNMLPGFSGDGGPATAAQMDVPCQVALDNAGNIYIPDQLNNRIRKVDLAGIITTIGGAGLNDYTGEGGPAVLADIGSPSSLTVDRNTGSIFILNEFNVRRIDSTGIVTTFAGNGNFGYTGDGGNCLLAAIGEPENVNAAPNGDIYLVDDFKNAVRKINACPFAVVDQQPLNIAVCANSNTIFTVNVINPGTYQWQVNNGTGWTNITDNVTYSGAVTNTLSVTGVNLSMDNYHYRCWLTNPCTNSCSHPASLTITNPVVPTINISASDNSICQGTNVIFTATAVNGGINPVYQWKKNGINVGTNTDSYSDNSLANGDIITCTLASSLNCVSSATVVSNQITMLVNAALVPAITITTTSTTMCAVSSANFVATAVNGGTSPTYQWKKNGINVGTNSNQYLESSVTDGDIITCTLTSSGSCLSVNSVTSNAITLTVYPVETSTLSISTPVTTICAGTPVIFTATAVNPGSNPVYQWRKNNIIVGTNSSTYTDNALAEGDEILCILGPDHPCMASAVVLGNTIVMHVTSTLTPTVSISTSNTSICKGKSVTFDATVANAGTGPTFQWFKNNLPAGTNSAIYTDNNLLHGDIVHCIVTITGSSCFSATTATSNSIYMNVFELPVVSLDQTASLCEGSNRRLDAGNFSSYLWNDGSSGRWLQVNNIGAYSVTVIDSHGCTGTGSTSITALLLQPKHFLPADTAVCLLSPHVIQADGGYQNYMWSNNSSGQTLEVKEPGLYWLQVTAPNGCNGKDSVWIKTKECLKGFYIPNAFSPNNDGRNDIFKPRIFGKLNLYKFSVYNRYGQILFETTDINAGWNGSLKSAKQENNVYTWTCTYQLEGEPIRTTKGTVLLIR